MVARGADAVDARIMVVFLFAFVAKETEVSWREVKSFAKNKEMTS